MMTGMGDSHFGNMGFGNQNASGIMDTRDAAVLYVFSPTAKQFSDVSMRPLQYGFDDNFLSVAEDVSDMNKQGADLANTRIKDLMSRTNLNHFLMPTQVPQMTFHANQLSGFYRFILILTEEKAGSLVTGNTMLNTNPNSQIRRIYTGYFTDEPYNPWTISENRHSLNHDAKMVITHKTVVGNHLHYGRFGPEMSINTSASEEVFHPTIATQLTSWSNPHNAAIHITTPENTVQSLEENEHHQILSMPGEGNVLREDGAQVTHDFLTMPGEHVGHILKGIVSYKSDMVDLGRLQSRRMAHSFDDDFTDQMSKRTKLAQKFALHRSMKLGELDLEVNQTYSAQDIDNLVGHRLSVVPLNHERPMFYDTADQSEASIVNQYSHLIATVVPAILSDAGLTAMEFEYGIVMRNGQPDPGFRVHGVETLLPGLPEADVMSMVRAAQLSLHNGVFDVIFQSKGDFTIAVKAHSSGNTVVRLNLLGMGYRNTEDFEWHSSLGGMISPLLGDTATNYSNSSNMEALISRVTGMSGPPLLGGDPDFMNLAAFHSPGPGDYSPSGRQDYMGDRSDEDEEKEVY